jgi:hypothetical protein
MEINEADKIDLSDVAEIEEGAAGVRVTWKNGDREFIDGASAYRLLERWRAKEGAEGRNKRAAYTQ